MKYGIMSFAMFAALSFQANGATVRTATEIFVTSHVDRVAKELQKEIDESRQYTEGLEYIFNTNMTASVISENWPDDVMIPQYAYSNGVRYAVTSIQIGNGDGVDNVSKVCAPFVDTLGEGSFLWFTNLSSVSLPCVINIGYSAFEACQSLKYFESVYATNIGQNAFLGCDNLFGVYLPNVTGVKALAFDCCISLVDVNLQSAKYIGNSSFAYCSSIKTISLPKAEIILLHAFENCTSLTTAYLPSLRLMDHHAFSGCTSLSEIHLDSVQEIRGDAFIGCTNLNIIDFGSEPRYSAPSDPGISEVIRADAKIIVPDSQYDEFLEKWHIAVSNGYRFIKHSDWDVARRYELNDITNMSKRIYDECVKKDNFGRDVSFVVTGDWEVVGFEGWNTDVEIFNTNTYERCSDVDISFSNGVWTCSVTLVSYGDIYHDTFSNSLIGRYDATNLYFRIPTWGAADPKAFVYATRRPIYGRNSLGLAYKTDVDLIPYYGDTCDFSDWVISGLEGTALSISTGPYYDSLHDEWKVVLISSGGLGVINANSRGGEGGLYATNLIYDAREYLYPEFTATRYRKNIGYTLRCQQDKILTTLAITNGLATTGSVSVVAQSATNYTDSVSSNVAVCATNYTDSVSSNVAVCATNYTDSVSSNVAVCATNYTDSVSSNVAVCATNYTDKVVADADTSYLRVYGNTTTNLNQSVQYVSITDEVPSTLTIELPEDGRTKDWIVYVTSVTNVALSLKPATYWVADDSYTNDIAPRTPTALYFTEATNGVFVIGRQEMKPITITE